MVMTELPYDVPIMNVTIPILAQKYFSYFLNMSPWSSQRKFYCEWVRQV